MDLDDLFEILDIPLRQPGPRGQRIIRTIFGLVLAGLSGFGIHHGVTEGFSPTSPLFDAAGVFVFVALALFGLLTVALGLRSRWPAWLVPISFALLFLVRLVAGA